MSNPLVSICVPIYNASPYIEPCVRSLMEQDYTNIEYVFVNDGSTDNSIEVLQAVLKDYPERQSQVHISHNDGNRGSAYTRRVLIEKAQGEYITYVDSDDRVDPDFVSVLVAEVLATAADMVMAPMKEYWGGHITEIQDELVSESLLEDCLYDHIGHLCGKLIRRQLLIAHTCYAPDGMNYLEDRLSLLKIGYYAQSVVGTDKTYYHYVHHASSITATKTDYHFDCLIRYWHEAEQLMKEWGVWEQYAALCRRKQVDDKTALMLQSRSMTTRQRYADLFRENELAGLRGLSPGFQLMGRLVHYHAWGLIALYQRYIDWRYKHKNK